MIDTKKVDEIRAAHEAEESIAPGGAALLAWAKRVHEHRGYLLDAIAEMRKAPSLAVGVRVRATHDRERDGEYEAAERAKRAQFNLHGGTIVRSSDMHGLCFCVQFPLGQAWYEPDELTPEPITSRVFAPTDAERDACPVLAEVAGKPEREAVLALAKEVARHRQEAAERRADAWFAATAPAAEHMKLARRPRVGPWVNALRMSAHGLYKARYDATGREVGAVWHAGEGRGWWGSASRAFADPIGIENDGATEEQARAAVDAVLREWADLDEDAPGVIPPCPVCSGPHPATWHDPPKPRTWTEEQIREAMRRADEDALRRGCGPATTDELMRELKEAR